MKPGRVVQLVWGGLIVALLVVEAAELTHLFTVPIQSALGNLLSFVFALVFTTILALVGAIFIGIYISQRLQSPTGFSAFEEEMLKMRADVNRIKEDVAELRAGAGKAPPPPGGGTAP